MPRTNANDVETAQAWYKQATDKAAATNSALASVIDFDELYDFATDMGAATVEKLETYQALSNPDKDNFIKMLNWPFPTGAPVAQQPAIQQVVQHNDGLVNASSAALYLMGGRTLDSDECKFLQALNTTFPGATISQMRHLAAKFVHSTMRISEASELGAPSIITTEQYSQWEAVQTGKSYMVGAFSLWSALEHLGLSCTSTSMPGDKLAMVYERNGCKLYQYDRFMVHTGTGQYVEATESEVNNFLDRLRFSGQALRYIKMPVDVYDVTLAFLSRYQVNAKNGVLEEGTLIDVKLDNPYSLPSFIGPMAVMCDHLLKGLATKKIVVRPKEPAFEALAIWVYKNVPIDDITKAATALRQKLSSIVSRKVTGYVEKFAIVEKMAAAEKIDALRKAAHSPATPATAVKKLEYARALRNKGLGDVVNHNVASVGANNLIEWVDTYQKGKAMIERAQQHPLYKGVTPQTRFVVYGVSYGHMTPLFSTLRHPEATPDRISFYDIAKAKDSTEVYHVGDVFSHKELGTWVFDDSNSHNLPKHLVLRNPNWTGDHYKVNKFIEARSVYIATKVSMNSFVTPTQQALWKTILLDKGYGWRLVKYGRLHNAEMYLVGVSGFKRPQRWAELEGDMQSISLCMELANDIIMIYQQQGVRAGHLIPTTDPPPLNLTHVWRALVRALPVAWTWFLGSAEIKMKSVKEIEEFSTFENVEIAEEYKDEDFDLDFMKTGDGLPPLPSTWRAAEDKAADRLSEMRITGMDYTKNTWLLLDAKSNVPVIGYGMSQALQDRLNSRHTERIFFDPMTQEWTDEYSGPFPGQEECVILRAGSQNPTSNQIMLLCDPIISTKQSGMSTKT